jgi:hypothetical protein
VLNVGAELGLTLGDPLQVKNPYAGSKSYEAASAEYL